MESKQSHSTDLMSNFQDIKAIVEMVMEADIFVNNRKRNVVEARMIIASMLRDMGYSLNAIGNLLNKDYTTIIHYNKKLLSLFDVDKVLLMKYLKCKEMIIVKEQPVNLVEEPDYKVEYHNLVKRIDILQKENEILRDERAELLKSQNNRLSSIFKLIEENTMRGYENTMERKLKKFFNE